MGWMKRILQGSNSRQRSNRSCEVDDRRSCSDEPNYAEEESTEGEETSNQITHIHCFSENGQDYLYGAVSTKNWVQNEELKLEDEDEQPTQPLQPSWALESSLCDPANIFQPFPFSFYFNNRNQCQGSCEEDGCSYSDAANKSADELADRDEETYHRVSHSSSLSGEGPSEFNGKYLHGAGWATYSPVQYEGSQMQHGDEQLSEAFNQSLVIRSSSVFDIANILEPSPFSFYPDNRCRDRFQHPECTHPYSFEDPIIANHESEDDSNQIVYYKKHPYPICIVCGKPIQVDASGRNEKNSFWPEKYCPRHDTDGSPRCFCCKRLKPRGTTYSTLNDRRFLCPECLDSAIMNSHECKPLEREIRNFFERLDMKVHQPTIPLYLVDRQGMEEDQGEKKGHHRVCEGLGAIHVFAESLGVTTFYNRPVLYATVEGERHKLVGYSNVKEIKILKACARLNTGQTLAHEMMHAWLALEGYHNLTLEEEEGFCQVIAHMWLNSQISVMSKSKTAPSPKLDFERRLAKYLRHDTETRTDNPYGTGFQLVKRAIDNYGLKGTLDHIRMTGSFPR